MLKVFITLRPIKTQEPSKEHHSYSGLYPQDCTSTHKLSANTTRAIGVTELCLCVSVCVTEMCVCVCVCVCA